MSYVPGNLTYEERCKLARITDNGDVWIHRKTGATYTITKRTSYVMVTGVHQSGRITTKQDHYLAGDYDPLKHHAQDLLTMEKPTPEEMTAIHLATDLRAHITLEAPKAGPILAAMLGRVLLDAGAQVTYGPGIVPELKKPTNLVGLKVHIGRTIWIRDEEADRVIPS